jgi:4-amino-4-deoxy-L-arabinose transferase-like glycosyltransferase
MLNRDREPARTLTVVLALVILAGFALRAHDLGRKSFWYDELRQIEVARMPLAQWNEALITHAARPLDYYLTRALLGYTRSEWLLRFPALMWGTLTIAVTYQLGRKLLGRAEGAIAAFLVALSATGVSFSQELRPYALYALIAAVSYWALITGLHRGSRAAWVVYAGAHGLGGLTHYFWLAIVASQVLFVGLAALTGQVPRGRLRAFGLAVAAGCAVLLATSDPLVILPLGQNYLAAILSAAAANQPPPVSLRAAGANPFAPELTYDFFAGRVLGPLGAGRGAALALFNSLLLIGVIAAVRARVRLGVVLLELHPGTAFLLAWLLAGPGLILGYLFYRNEIFAIRYVLFALPAYLLLVARGTVILAERLPALAQPRARLAPALSLAVLAGFGWINLGSVAEYYRTPKDDWRRIGAFLQSNVQPGDAIFAPNVQSFVEFYFPGATEFLVYADTKREAQVAYGQHARTWFVMSDWVTYDITDTRKVIALYPGVVFQWDGTAFVKYTHRGKSEAEMQLEAENFQVPAPSLSHGVAR